jgi:hypothetical protein
VLALIIARFGGDLFKDETGGRGSAFLLISLLCV